jgi:hypothetical protein
MLPTKLAPLLFTVSIRKIIVILFVKQDDILCMNSSFMRARVACVCVWVSFYFFYHSIFLTKPVYHWIEADEPLLVRVPQFEKLIYRVLWHHVMNKAAQKHLLAGRSKFNQSVCPLITASYFYHLPTRATCPTHLIIYLVMIIILVKGQDYDYEAPHYAVFLSLMGITLQ